MTSQTEAPKAPAPSSGTLPFDKFMALLRTPPEALDAFFAEFGTKTTVASTRVNVHFRYLKAGPNGQPRINGLADRLAQEIINYAIPRSDIDKARQTATGPHDARQYSKLHRKAAGLFTEVATTGEGGELLLYLMTEAYLRLPQLLCKMPLKTSMAQHYHGVDGIHGAADPDTGTLALYWGESKLHKAPANAISACLESLAPYVLADEGSSSPTKRDLELLTDNLDLVDDRLEQAVLRYLDPDDPAFNKLTYRGVALVGFDSESYFKDGVAVLEAELSAALIAGIASWHDSVGFHVGKHKLSEIHIELFCVPFPSVEDLRAAFLQELGIG